MDVQGLEHTKKVKCSLFSVSKVRVWGKFKRIMFSLFIIALLETYFFFFLSLLREWKAETACNYRRELHVCVSKSPGELLFHISPIMALFITESDGICLFSSHPRSILLALPPLAHSRLSSLTLTCSPGRVLRLSLIGDIFLGGRYLCGRFPLLCLEVDSHEKKW